MRLIIEYRANREQLRLVGAFYVNDTFVSEFDETFEGMINQLSELLQHFKEPTVVAVRRTDAKELIDVEMTAELVNTIRSDPKKAIQELSPEKRIIQIRDSVPVKDSMKLAVRGGYRTLADAFGEELYCRIQDEYVESPFDGRYTRLLNTTTHMTLSGPKKILSPSGQLLHGNVVTNWFVVSTEHLLGMDWENFFFPYEWNIRGPWVERKDLQKMYEEFVKEKQHVQQSAR